MGSSVLVGFIDLQMLENIFLVMFVAGLVFMVISAIMSGAFESEFGEGSAFGDGDASAMGGDVGEGGAHGTAEVGWASHDLATFSPLSPTVICAFITAFGGVGFLSLHTWEMGPIASSAMALVAGVVFGGAIFLSLAWVFDKTQGSSVGRASSVVGREAEVIEPVPSQGSGRVAYVLSGQRMTMPAQTADGASIPQGAQVLVKEVTQQYLVVEETRESWLAREKQKAN